MTDTEQQEVGRVLDGVPEIRAHAPFVAGKAMLVGGSYTSVVFVRGVDEGNVGAVSGLKNRIVLGELSLHDSAGNAGIAIGLSLADRLASVTGTEVVMISPYGFQTALSGLSTPPSRKFSVRGIYESKNKDYDANYAFIDLPAARELFHMEGKVNGIDVRLSDIGLAESVKEQLRTRLGPEYTVATWYDLHSTLYAVMRIERWTSYALLSLIILVATVNMLGSLTMGVMEKRRDIATLKALGMTSRRVLRVFMAEGLLIGTIGTVIGVAVGLLVLFLQVRFRLFALDPNVYIIPAVPVELHWSDFLTVAAASLGLSWLAAYVPARRAASTQPAEALRWE
jgi:lipoprotein-releasing system permease protein